MPTARLVLGRLGRSLLWQRDVRELLGDVGVWVARVLQIAEADAVLL